MNKKLLYAKFTNVSEWKAILTAIGEISEDAMFICNTDGITFRGIDPTHISLLDITFPESSFEEFDSSATFFGIRTEDFKNVLNAADAKDTIELKMQDEGNLLVLINGTLSMQFSVKLIEKTEINTPVPKVSAKTKIGITPNTLNRIISNLEKVSEFVTIQTIHDKVEFSGKGDIGNAKIDLDITNSELQNLETTEDSLSIYSLEYMAKIIRSIGRASKSINIGYSSKSPMHIQFDMPSNVNVAYYLAPRIQD